MVDQRNKLHPQKLMMWIAMGSMFMVFAGFTSAFILQSTNPNWLNFKLPKAFYVSTIVIILSSVTMHKAVGFFKERNMPNYKTYMLFTIVLGLLFMVLQLLGFYQLLNINIRLDGNVSGAFLYVISGLHLLHMLAGVIALIVMYMYTFSKKTKTYSPVGHEVLATFWHFVDILWIYLFLFFLINFN